MPIEDKTKKIKDIAIAVFLVFVMVGGIYSAFWGPLRQYLDIYANSVYPTKTFSASAEARVTASPDVATFDFSVVSEGANPETLGEANNNAMAAAIAFVKSKGVDEKDIKTTQYSLTPKYVTDEKTKKTSISGYTLTQTALVKIRALSKVAEIVGGLPELGINQIGSISFSIDDPDKFLAEARKNAFEKARVKAAEMASENGIQLGEIVGFWESAAQPYYGISSKYGMGGGSDVAAPAAPQIQPGAEEITVSVSISYKIK